ncbi:YqaA family protein [Pantoea sp. 1.19]|uniref:YqaA family protein n=1 Tax=Pantoea sp. 1.19 TaxID=1925589 RepID=UPI000948F087|nr:YqaA family protein [Pantoea sp. 1.19]
MSELTALAALFASSLLSATLLPGGSEVVLAGLLMAHPDWLVRLLLIASLGNTLGGVTNLLIGRLLPERAAGRHAHTARRWLRRWGAPALLLSWVPVIGDVLCVAAGWLRLSWLPCLAYLAIGKAARYAAVAAATLQGVAWWH